MLLFVDSLRKFCGSNTFVPLMLTSYGRGWHWLLHPDGRLTQLLKFLSVMIHDAVEKGVFDPSRVDIRDDSWITWVSTYDTMPWARMQAGRPPPLSARSHCPVAAAPVLFPVHSTPALMSLTGMMGAAVFLPLPYPVQDMATMMQMATAAPNADHAITRLAARGVP